MIIVDTATGGNVWKDYYTKLKSSGYKIIMYAVYAAQESCEKQGAQRAFNEGKKYSSGPLGVSWRSGVKWIKKLFNKARKDGNTGVFGVYRNNFAKPVPNPALSPNVIRDCDVVELNTNNKIGAFSHISCVTSGTLYVQSNQQLKISSNGITADWSDNVFELSTKNEDDEPIDNDDNDDDEDMD